MGLDLKHPIIAAASPLTETLDGIKKLEDGGASAVILSSLFEEQILADAGRFADYFNNYSGDFAESQGFFPAQGDFSIGPDEYLELVRSASESTDIPLIASLNCVTGESWSSYARQLDEAGAHGIELSIFPLETNPEITGSIVEERYLEILSQVKKSTKMPVALRLSPYFSAFAHHAKMLDQNGADALVMFNRFFQPDIDIEKLEYTPVFTASQPDEIRLPVLWIALLYQKLKASLAASGGVDTYAEVVKYLLAGADTVMTAGALMRHGPKYINTLVSLLSEWMEKRGFESISKMRGIMSYASVPDPLARERANYIKIIESYH